MVDSYSMGYNLKMCFFYFLSFDCLSCHNINFRGKNDKFCAQYADRGVSSICAKIVIQMSICWSYELCNFLFYSLKLKTSRHSQFVLLKLCVPYPMQACRQRRNYSIDQLCTSKYEQTKKFKWPTGHFQSLVKNRFVTLLASCVPPSS